MHCQRRFYDRDTVLVAQQLLGKRLVRRDRAGLTAGCIVEVEAYLHEGDPACHAARGRTPSNAAMFGRAGLAYVYPIHSRWCFNVVTRHAGCACAVLVRAIEPGAGISLMQRRRGTQALRDLARGPARLCEALGIDRSLDHWDLTRGHRLWIEEQSVENARYETIGVTARIGVTSAQDKPWRFFYVDCPYVSGTGKFNAARTLLDT